MFHVPEAARLCGHPRLASTAADGNNGAFVLPSCEPGWALLIIASDGLDWEHVSVHAARRDGQQRIPTWKEMCLVKCRFWDDDDIVMQLHPRQADYVNQHLYTLHLWRPIGVAIPTPDKELVGD